jgi:hypothetical protein
MSRKFSITRRPDTATPMPPQSTVRRPGSVYSANAKSGRVGRPLGQTQR